MKKIQIGITFLTVSMLVLAGCSTSNTSNSDSALYNDAEQNVTASVNYELMDLEKEYQTLDEISQDSDLIAEVKLTGNVEAINYGNANFITSEAEVKKVVKGEAEVSSKNIKLLELSTFNLNLTKKSDEMFLFLRKYEGPVTNNEGVYVISGVYQGKFNVIENKIEYDGDDYNGVNTFQKDIENKDMSEIEDSIKNKIARRSM